MSKEHQEQMMSHHQRPQGIQKQFQGREKDSENESNFLFLYMDSDSAQATSAGLLCKYREFLFGRIDGDEIPCR